MSYRARVLNSTLWETDGVSVDEFLPNAWQSMWNGERSAYKDKSTRALGKLKTTCDVSNEFAAAKSHCTNDLVDHVRFDCENLVRWSSGWGTLSSPREKRVRSTSNCSLHCTIFILPKSWWQTLLSIRLDRLRTPDEWDYLIWLVTLAANEMSLNSEALVAHWRPGVCPVHAALAWCLRFSKHTIVQELLRPKTKLTRKRCNVLM